MLPAIDITRRTFLVHAGRGTVALAVLGVAACGPSAIGSISSSADVGPSGAASPAPADGAGGTSGLPASAPSSPATGGVTWHRANLGFVSAYVLARLGEAAIVDTGVAGSEGAIADALTAAGLGWDAVGHVILTHRHGDHVGSTEAVLRAAPDATAYAGAGDMPAISAPRPLTAVGDGETVFGLRIVTTPGHTAGHIAVLDEVGRILVAGDALGTTGGTLAGSNPQFTEDAALASASVVKLGALQFDILLVGHGDPILEGASAKVAALAALG
jgi:glyoxylase-like metal-dependent hydrolase (beta-lactamase superfamily II)